MENFSHNYPEFSVSEISTAIKTTLEETFRLVRVRGEVSGFKLHSSGHMYFALKDDKSVLNAVAWRGSWQKFTNKPEEGLEVICTGRITSFAGKSQYQLVVEQVELAGIGALMALLEKRKAMLSKEGLFDESRKKQIPYLPRSIGVITSPTGSVIRDIIHRISDRFPLPILIWPVQVQGEGAAEQVTKAIEGFNNLPQNLRPDTLIVARGGGSLEDLWAFNEEIVVRAVAKSNIPTISAIGHETDTTLIDLASDKRAPTPTAAAEMAVPVKHELMLSLKDMGLRLNRAVLSIAQNKKHILELTYKGLLHPRHYLEYVTQKLDDLVQKLNSGLPQLLKFKEERLKVILAQLSSRAITNEIKHKKDIIDNLGRQLILITTNYLNKIDEKLNSTLLLLDALSYQKVLERGFAVVRNDKGNIIPKKALLAPSQIISIEFSDGNIGVVTEPFKKKIKKESSNEEQGNLF